MVSFADYTIYKNPSICIEYISKQTNIDKLLLLAIAKVESKWNPKAINKNKNGSYDYGLFQVNSFWYDYFDIKSKKKRINNVCLNTLLAGFVIKTCQTKHKNNIRYILSCYHRGKIDKKGLRYANLVLAKYKSLANHKWYW